MIFETRTNQIFVTDIPSKLEEVQPLIAKIDIPVRQVMIEARIVEAETASAGTRRQARHSDLRGLRGGIRLSDGQRQACASPGRQVPRHRLPDGPGGISEEVSRTRSS